MVKYSFENGNFVIDSFDKAKTFSSFLPGIAGLKGIPMWAFYVNRGQAISSFGIQDKGQPILEFSPASITYQNVSRNGFRTFLKVNGELVEAFDSTNESEHIKRKMYINEAQVSILERNEDYGFEIKVDYFGMPQENFAALVRKVEIKNITDQDLTIEVLDGCTAIFPHGVGNADYKAVGNLLRSWMDVYNLEQDYAFYKLRASTGDEAEINEVEKGNFYLSFSDEEELIKPIVDADLIFGHDTSLAKPVNFSSTSLKEIQNSEQITANKVPCGFTGINKVIKANETVRINTIIGHAQDVNHIENQKEKLVDAKYIDRKQTEAYNVIRNLTDDIDTKTGNKLFDEYARQCYLDNLLRGGYPIKLKNKKDGFVYHVYSRKHGDLERDYNWFSIAPEYYSQGNGNFRDANQNRRNDGLFNPEVGTYNIKTFMSLIQMDGYNPLSVEGSSFNLKAGSDVEELVNKCFNSHQDDVKNILKNNFTPGRIINYIYNNNVDLKVDEETMLEEVFSQSEQNIEASFGEGYWIDHWTYNMDLVDTFLRVYPDRLEELLFEDETYKYFDSPVYVLPRSEKYVLNKSGNVRQYGSLLHYDDEKLKHLGIESRATNWIRTENGKGDIYETNLFVKLLSLGLVKYSSIDPAGIGIEMDGNKPGWNDAMNGLPGLFGSGVGETFELVRVLRLVKEACETFEGQSVNVPEELALLLAELTDRVNKFFEGKINQHTYWDQVATARENYRESIRFGITGKEITINLSELDQVIKSMLDKIEIGIEKAKELGDGVYPTYLVFGATDFEVVKDEAGNKVISHYGLPKVVVNEFKVRALPRYAEAPARSMKVIKDKEANLLLHKNVQATEIYDKKLLMYKTSESIADESNEIGRARAFTPGWLEREAIFLHMTYKYLLGLAKAGLYDEYIEAVKTNVVPFLKPEVYGRSTLENSSFVASSVNPNPHVHGQGFYARLTGSTAEFLSMWTLMMYGNQPFRMVDGELIAEFNPIIPGSMFDEDNKVSFKFLGHTTVTYVNPKRIDTYNESLSTQKIQLVIEGETTTVEQSYLPQKYATMLREGNVEEVTIYFG
ncbi:hypothetical protein [Haloplasma contractile]|nr:hypothetical protein [Haloplasma contractile]